jgi:hypothetical protein
MLQRVVLGQVRFNLPGLAVDARGVVGGKQLAVRFAAIDRLVSFLRVLSAEQSLDDLQPGLRIVTARGGAGTREAIVVLPFASPGLGDVVAHGARLAGGQTFTGTGRHFVQFRDAHAPLGYDVAAPVEGAGDLILHGAEQGVPYRIESEIPLATLLTRLSLVRVFGRGNALPAGPLMLTARRGLGSVVAGYLHRAARAGGMRAAAALCDGGNASAFSPGSSFWLFRIEGVPPRLHGLLARTPGLDLYVPVMDNVAVATGYRHPVHLESCRGSFARDRLHLFSPRGVTEVVPAPVLAALDDIVRIRAPAPLAASVGVPVGRGGERESPGAPTARPEARPDLAVTLRLEPSGAPLGRPVAALIPWPRVPWLQRLFYAMPPTVIRAHRVALLERGVLLQAAEALEGIPFGTLLEAAAPDVLVPLGTRLVPAVSRELVAERLGAIGGALIVFPDRAGRPLRIPPEALTPLEPRLLLAIAPDAAELAAGRPADPPFAENVEIENQPLGPMPLWGLGRAGRTG